jgi:hypothetical protein
MKEHPRRRFTDYDPDKVVFWFCVVALVVERALS